MKTAYRKDLIRDAHKYAGGQLTLRDIELAVALYEEAIIDALFDAYKVQLPGFLTLYPAVQKARKGRNIVTGKMIDIPERVSVKYKPGRHLKSVANELTVDDVKLSETQNFRMPTGRGSEEVSLDELEGGESVADALNKKEENE